MNRYPTAYPLQQYGYSVPTVLGMTDTQHPQLGIPLTMPPYQAYTEFQPQHQQQQMPQINPTPAKPPAAHLARTKKPLFSLDEKPDTAPAPQPPKPKEKEVVQPVAVEESKHEVKGRLFEVPRQEEAKAEQVLEETKTEKVVEQVVEDEFSKYLVPLKPENQRKKYTVNEMNKIANHPYTLRKKAESSHDETLNNIKFRGNYKPKQPGINLDLDIKLETVEKKFMPEKMMGNALADISTEERLLRELKAILNRLMEDNLAASVDEIRAKQVERPEHQILLAKAVFESAARQSKFSRVFASLTSQFWGLEEFKKGILNLMRGSVDKTLQQQLDETSKSLDDQLRQETDTTVRKIFEERRETVLSKTEENYFGCMTFMAELYRADRFTDHQLLQILNRFVDNLDASTARSFDIVITIAGRTLESRERRKVDELFAKLNSQLKKVTLSSYLMYHMDQLKKKRAAGWPETPKPEKTSVAPTQPSGGNSLMSINHSNLAQQGEKLRPKTSWGGGCQTKNQSPWQPAATSAAAAPKQTIPKTDDEYRQMLASLHGDPVILFHAKDPKLVEDVQASYPPAFVHFVVDLVLNKKSKERLEAGAMFESLLRDRNLSTDYFVEGFRRFAPDVDDFLDDCPKLFCCVGDIFCPLLQGTMLADCGFLVQACKELKGHRSGEEGVETLLSAMQLAMKHETTPAQIRSKMGQNLKVQLMQELGVTEAQLTALSERFGTQEVLADATTASWKVQNKTGRKSKPASGAQNRRGADLLMAVVSASVDELKTRMGEGELPGVGQFTGKLFKRSAQMPKEQMESFVKLLEFYPKKSETQLSFLTELDRCDGLERKHRKALLECLLSQNLVSKETMHKFGQRAVGGGLLGSLIKSDFSNGTASTE